MQTTIEKNNVVTIAKAIGIICVVLAHSMNPNWLTWKVIYTFHMPLFFMLSGFCFKEKYLYDAKLFLKRKILGIYIPFVVYSLIFLALHNVFAKCHIYESNWVYGWKDFAWNISRIVARMSHNEGMLGVFWFLKELFFGNLIFYGVLKLCKGEKWLSVMVLSVITIIMTITEWRIPYISITKVTFYSALFIALGNVGRAYADKFNKWWIYVITIFLIVGYVSIGKNIAIGLQNIYTLIPYTLTAIGGSILIMNVSKWIDANRGGWSVWLLFAGNHTLEIMALHFITFKLISFGIIQLYDMPIERLEEFPILMNYSVSGWWIVYTVVGVALPLLFAYGKEKVKEYVKTRENIN